MRKIKNESRVPERPSIFDRVLLILIAIPVLLSFIASLAPPTAKDTLLYHFSVPKQFIAQGGNAVIEGNIASYLALGTEMHVVWAMLLGNIVSERAAEAAAGATVWLFFPLLLAAIFGIARETGISRRWALMAVLMAATVPTAYHVAASAYIDVALALYVLLATYSLTRWWKTLDKNWLILMAIFLGAALSAKLTTLFVMAAFALVILFRVRKAQESEPDRIGKIAAFGFGAFLLAGVIASPWYLRTWAETGSPIFPFYMSIWEGKAPGWDVDRSNLFQMMNSQYGGANKNALDYLLAPWNISVTAQPEIAANFDGVLGVAFLIGLPLLIFALWKLELSVEAKIFSGVALVMFLFWLFSSQQLRYLLPILPLLAITIAAAVESMSDRRDVLNKSAKFAIGFAAIACIAASSAWFLQKAPLRVVLGGETPDAYLIRNIDYYPYYQWLNTETPTDAKVWLINMRRDSYHLDRPYFSDYLFEDVTLRKWIWESNSADELREKAKAAGFNYILARHDFLFGYDRSTLVDDDKPRAVNEAKLRMAREVLMDQVNTVRSDNKFSLVKVF
ncbi:MAG: glycosyltransferase family 39 protein [Acidobacteria bacterium]|nr:glycosyltransferase family 39 protein [Acidobacteriota bacterium]